MTIYYVTSTADIGSNTLRSAISSANIDPGSIIMITATGTINLATKLSIDASMTIIGPGVNNLTIQKASFAININLFEVLTNGYDIIFENIRFTGNAVSIINSYSNLTLNNCEFDNTLTTSINSCLPGRPGITMTITDCTFTNNQSYIIYIDYMDSTNLIINRCTFTNNIFSCIYSGDDSFGSNCTISNTLFSGNQSDIVTFMGNLTINNSNFTNNIDGIAVYYKNGRGGVYCNIFNTNITGGNSTNSISSIFFSGSFGSSSTYASLLMDNCQIYNNFSSDGGLLLSEGNIQVYNCTINNNSATNNGAGIYLTLPSLVVPGAGAVTVDIINSTITGNICQSSNNGGGIYINDPNSTSTPHVVNIIGCTITDNTAPNNGGGVYINNANAKFGNNVIAQNNSATPDVYNSSTVASSLGYNFIGTDEGNSPLFTSTGDQAGTTGNLLDPLLNPLAYNGGYTQTMLPQTTPIMSPLIGAGSNSIVNTYYTSSYLQNAGQPIDQRGFSRIVDGIVDIGSVEYSSVICFPSNTQVLVRNIKTGITDFTSISNIDSSKHQVYDTINNKYINIKLVAKTGVTNVFYLLSKGLISNNIPCNDLLVTGGHVLNINGVPIKAKNIVGAQKIISDFHDIYTICTVKATTINIEGIDAWTFGYNKFIDYTKKRNIIWTCQ